tara:strand:+ start:103 stop:474 length:372 start_codon:yes stop_codon:yes gene_type:complete
MSEENLKRMSNSELLLKQFKKIKEKKNKPGTNTKGPELDSYNKFVDKISAGLMGPMGTTLGKKLSKAELLEIEGFRPTKELTKTLMRKAGASPSKVKAVTGDAMSRGGEVDVVDLTTEMVIDE